jgi:hypothetical protein
MPVFENNKHLNPLDGAALTNMLFSTIKNGKLQVFHSLDLSLPTMQDSHQVIRAFPSKDHMYRRWNPQVNSQVKSIILIQYANNIVTLWTYQAHDLCAERCDGVPAA